MKKYLSQKLEKIRHFDNQIKTLEKAGTEINTYLDIKIPNICMDIVKNLNNKDLTKEADQIKKWLKTLNEFFLEFVKIEKKFQSPKYDIEDLKSRLNTKKILESLENVHSKLEKVIPLVSPEETAFKTLTILTENYKQFEDAQTKFSEAYLAFKKSSALLAYFLKSRDEVLEELYDKVKDRFVELYSDLHDPEESGFQAKIEPEASSLNFSVDFFGRGMHPPHALHSEGHQDSMGVCLFFALSEVLNEGLVDLIMLDDIVMSIDTDHRKEFCRLLNTKFKDKQFLITTHDKIWANHMNKDGLVRKKNLIEFYKWDLEVGPYINDYNDMWTEIEHHLSKNNIKSAAGCLRYGLEQFFSYLCDRLRAKIIFHFDSRWTLGELFPSSYGKYRSFLSDAKRAANSWNKKNLVQELKDVENTVNNLVARTDAENWTINTAVHYNNWENFTVNDFKPVVDAFKELCSHFECDICNVLIYVTQDNFKEVNLRCSCESINWNLVKKKE